MLIRVWNSRRAVDLIPQTKRDDAMVKQIIDGIFGVEVKKYPDGTIKSIGILADDLVNGLLLLAKQGGEAEKLLDVYETFAVFIE